MVGGVCGGIAEYFDIDPTLVRLVYAVLSIFTTVFPGFILYIVCLIIIPRKPVEGEYNYNDGNFSQYYQQSPYQQNNFDENNSNNNNNDENI
ncbi:MAG: PspC domain-containing protein [Clostridiales bacterium]|nr:PspC domain-containing protein [Clostridiales bacterium]